MKPWGAEGICFFVWVFGVTLGETHKHICIDAPARPSSKIRQDDLAPRQTKASSDAVCFVCEWKNKKRKCSQPLEIAGTQIYPVCFFGCTSVSIA